MICNKPGNFNFRVSFAHMMLVSLNCLLIISGCRNPHPPAQMITLNPLFTENMVIQQKQKIPVWGKGEPGGEVTVTFKGERCKAIVSESGNWKVNLSPANAGGPFQLIISGEQTLTIPNVMIGEVWICSGQSNMEYALEGLEKIDASREVDNDKLSNIRLLMVDKVMSTHTYDDFDSQGWKICSPETRNNFSAVAYFFGRRLARDLNVPIGLIETAWGGTPVETWISNRSITTLQHFSDSLVSIGKDNAMEIRTTLHTDKNQKPWPDQMEQVLKEQGTQDHGFQTAECNNTDWQRMMLPGYWENAGLNMDGLVWFCRDIEIPKSWEGQDLTLNLGKINDFDITWFNGTKIGRGTDVSEFRVYRVPSSLVKRGRNRIALQVLDLGNFGGIYGPARKMNLTYGQESISLAGEWQYIADPVQVDIKNLPKKRDNNSEAYNGMINPIIPYGIRGVIWYQGEANVEWAYQYRKLFKTLISDWRTVWGQGDFPFLFVQLPNFMEVKPLPSEDAWAEMREAQAMALDLPNTGMAVSIDIGEAKDIHPGNKWEVGRRLALNALASVYKKEIPFSGPRYKSMYIDGDKIRIQFSHLFGGLKIRSGDTLQGFAIAGEDKKFVWASALIEGDEVIVHNSGIAKPVAVRYAWASNPQCNLINKANLPASPFRTDQWEGITYGKQK